MLVAPYILQYYVHVHVDVDVGKRVDYKKSMASVVTTVD